MRILTGIQVKRLMLIAAMWTALIPLSIVSYATDGKDQSPSAEEAQPLRPLEEMPASEQTESLSLEAEQLSIPEETTLIGDMNKDGMLSVADLALVAVSLGQTAGAVDWSLHELADLNDDGIVDIHDLSILAGQLLNEPAIK
jgi:hypothetical protein